MSNPVYFKKKATTALPSTVNEDTFYVTTTQEVDRGGGAPANKGALYVGGVKVGQGLQNIQNDSTTPTGIIMGNLQQNIAQGAYSTAVGNGAVAKGAAAFAESRGFAQGNYSHGENSAKAIGDYSHAGGVSALATGSQSFTHGNSTNAKGTLSVAFGESTIANDNQFVIGRNNNEDTQTGDEQAAFVVGNGTSIEPGNAMTLNWLGDLRVSGDIYVGSSDHAATDTDGVVRPSDYSEKRVYTFLKHIQDNAPSHNGYFVSENIQDMFDSYDFLTHVQDRTFKDIFPGQYFTVDMERPIQDTSTGKVTGYATYPIQFQVADLNYFEGADGIESSGHVVLTERNTCELTYVMRKTDDTSTGYAGSAMYVNVIPKMSDKALITFDDHLFMIPEFVSTGVNTTAPSPLGYNGLGSPNAGSFLQQYYWELLTSTMINGTGSGNVYNEVVGHRACSVYNLSSIRKAQGHVTWTPHIISNTRYQLNPTNYLFDTSVCSEPHRVKGFVIYGA